jgi:hypothetical protein
MARHIVALCFAALGLVLAGPVVAQTPTVQNPALVHPYTTATVTTPAQQIALLQQQVAALQAAVAALQVKTQLVTSDGTNFVIKAPGSVTIAAQQQASISSSVLSVSAMVGATLQAGTTLGLQGALVQINGGGVPAARLGDQVVNGAVSTGSATVLIGR